MPIVFGVKWKFLDILNISWAGTRFLFSYFSFFHCCICAQLQGLDLPEGCGRTDRHTEKQASGGVVPGWRNLSILGAQSVYYIRLNGEVGFSIQLNKGGRVIKYR